MEKNVPINKGNYNMDTVEREVAFEDKRAFGWEEGYAQYRKSWSEYPKQEYVSEYPLLIDIELSSLCNLNCPMCYTITDDFKRKVHTQLMEWLLFKKIVDEIGGKVPAVRLSLRGEPTLHPNLVQCIRYCKEKGIKEVSFLTNGSKLDEHYFIDVAKAGADWITISIDGVDEEYELIRRPLKFSDTLQRLKNICEIKREKGWKKPVIKVQGIWPAIKKCPSKYYNLLAPYVDLIAFNPLIDYLGNDDDIVYEQDFSCPQVYQRLVIGSDGNVLLCSNDEDGDHLLGNVCEQSVYQIWHGERLNEVRTFHSQGRFKEINVCRKCYLPRATEDNERAYINEREIVIKNYINRSQNIGE